MTVGAEAKAILDQAGTDLTAVYRTAHVPDDAAFPYASFLDPISDAPALSGDAQTIGRRRLLQVDLWQTEEGETDDLLDEVVAALDGAASTTGYRFRVTDVTLVPEDDDVVHHSLTVSVARAL